MNAKPEQNNPKLEEARAHMKAARKSFREGMETLLPPGFVQHRRAARHEMLLAVRSLVDAAIEEIEKDINKTEPPKS